LNVLQKAMNSSKNIFLFLLLLWIDHCFPQQYNFKVYSTKNGLANSTINNISQDSKGYIWFATQGGGISRFDGKQFKNYTKNDGLVSNDVTSVCEDNEGKLWIGTSEGVSVFDGIRFVNYTSKNGLTNDLIYSIYKDSKGVLWFSTFGGGIDLYDGKSFKSITKKDGLPTNEIFCVQEDHEGMYWIGTYREGLCKFDGKKFKKYTKKDGLSSNSVFCMMNDEKNNLWLGTAGGGLSSMSNNQIKPLMVSEKITNDLIGSIIEDKKGNIWIASEHGLIKYDGKKYSFFSEKEGLSSNKIQALCLDYEDNIWIGTLSAGVCLFKNEAIVNYTEQDGLSKNNVSAIFQDSRGSYLIGTNSGGGINIYDNSKITPLTNIRELSKSTVFSIYEDKGQKIWIGLESGGIAILSYNGKNYSLDKTIKKLNDVSLNGVTKILSDKKGNTWISTYGSGIFAIQNEKAKQYSINNGLSSNDILTIFEDKKGNIWIGSSKSGVTKFDGSAFNILTTDSGLPDNNIGSICEDKKGRIYFGTYDGLSCYDGKKFKTISLNEGLCSNYITALCTDSMDNLWVGTDKGVNKLKLSDNFDIISIKHYGEQAGLKGIEVNANAMLLDRSNNLWIGTIDGLARYSMNFDYVNTTSPNVILTGIKLFYDKVDWKKYIKTVDEKTGLPVEPDLSYKNNHLTFDFQALTTDNVKYSFILEGLDNDWSPPTTKTEAPYPNIPPGKDYTFKVKILNSDGIWSKESIAYRFTIRSPFYQTWWFYSLLVLIITAAVLLFVNYRTKRLQREKKILEDKVTERTLELKGANEQLSVAFQDIKDSIQYAKKIQEAILPLESKIKLALPDSFILFKPRDIVSGDFYWFASVEKDGNPFHIIAVADCTGHGVPGAFMSMIGNTILNEIVTTKGFIEPSTILNQLHQGIRISLKQKENESRDGMDIVLCTIDPSAKRVKYAGANRPIWIIRNDNSLEEIKATKSAIGGLTDEFQTFESHELQLNKGERIYLFSDGFADQFGGGQGKKLMTKKFKEILLSLKDVFIQDQKSYLNNFIEDWKKGHEQVDDILVVGIKL
jgi:ligand-binding sensor domain-containing protein/serine phosphatase RsbU (regulator of sigma subunit)